MDAADEYAPLAPHLGAPLFLTFNSYAWGSAQRVHAGGRLLAWAEFDGPVAEGQTAAGRWFFEPAEGSEAWVALDGAAEVARLQDGEVRAAGSAPLRVEQTVTVRHEPRAPIGTVVLHPPGLAEPWLSIILLLALTA